MLRRTTVVNRTNRSMGWYFAKRRTPLEAVRVSDFMRRDAKTGDFVPQSLVVNLHVRVPSMPASSILLWSYGVVAVAFAFSPEFPRSHTHTRRRVRTRLRPLVSVSENPRNDLFDVLGFHHVELWCGDATHTSSRWCFGLGMRQVATSTPATGNSQCASICAQSGDMKFLFTAPLQVLDA